MYLLDSLLPVLKMLKEKKRKVKQKNQEEILELKKYNKLNEKTIWGSYSITDLKQRKKEPENLKIEQ